MCGISGIASKSLERAELQGTIGRMAWALRHRGPDGMDVRCFVPPAVSQNVALAHNRLAIIDVSAAGREPMSNEDGRVWLVFNGEIYNFECLRRRLEACGHQFSSHTDAETILHLYEEVGPACVKELNGIFAFAILDLRRDLLFLARDPIGVKPLFYAATNDHFLFGSEIKAILASSRVTPKINWQAVSDFFTFLYVPGPETIYEGIRHLPPAHCLTLRLNDNSISMERYWDACTLPAYQKSSYDQLKERLREELAAAVKHQLMSDVPIGVFLSGGIDSTIVAGLAKREKADIQTYTLSFKSEEYRFYAEGDKGRAVSRHLGTRHFELPFELGDLAEILDLVEYSDQPFANPTSFLMHRLSQKAREHITVALCGAGGDELFAGYPRFKALRLARRLGWIPRALLRFSGSALALLSDSHRTPHLRRARKFLNGLSPDFCEQYLNWTYFMNEGRKDELLHWNTENGRGHTGLRPSVEVLRTAFNQSPGLDGGNNLLQMELKTFLADNILEYTDRMSMAMGLEVRVPLLDARFVETSLNTPFAYKMWKGHQKAILVDAFAEFFPLEVRKAPKRGFNAPLGQWVDSLLEPYFEASSHDSHPLKDRLGEDLGAAWKEDGILDFAFIERLRAEHRRGKRDNSHELFACAIFDIWWRKYIKKTQPLVHWSDTKA
jgi:asparagine synthase (glutamine-hydrolysing)